VQEAFEDPDPHKPGNIAIVRPSDKALCDLDRDGPQETRAGDQDSRSITTASGSRHHRGASIPRGGGTLRNCAHTVDW
jgi:hypothetical protein